MELPRLALINDVAGVARAEVAILKAAGYDVDFYELPLIGASWPPLAKALILPLRLASYLPVIGKLRRGNYTFLHIHFVSQGIVGLAVGKPFFIHAHGSDLHVNFKNPVKRALSLLVLRRSQGIFYVTPNLRDYLAAFENKAHLLGNPIDTSLFRPLTMPSAISEVLIFARLEAVKGVDRIFERVAELSGIVNLTAIGWGPWARDYSKRFGSMVHFIPPIPHEEIPTLLQKFDAVIGQMHQGTLGLSELEALAAGRIVFTCVDQRLYSSDPPPVVYARDGDGIIEALRRLSRDQSEIRRLARAGPAWVEKYHGPRKHLEGLTQAYLRS